jgi:hypothetical protein
MLNKSICQKCHKKHYGTNKDNWENFDDEFWENNHVVVCPAGHQGFFVSCTKTKEPAPAKCFYLLEQVVSNAE